MHFIEEDYEKIYEIKKSKFCAYLTPYDNFKLKLQFLKEKHPKARHFVYAYRYLNKYNQIVENSSDDGEPKGTSGKPTLTVLGGAGIINSAVIIVRYFGGIKLGTGGLVRAYGTSVKEVLDVALLKEFFVLRKKKLVMHYSQVSQVEYLLETNNIKIISKDFAHNVIFIVESSPETFVILSRELLRDIIVKDIDEL